MPEGNNLVVIKSIKVMEEKGWKSDVVYGLWVIYYASFNTKTSYFPFTSYHLIKPFAFPYSVTFNDYTEIGLDVGRIINYPLSCHSCSSFQKSHHNNYLLKLSWHVWFLTFESDIDGNSEQIITFRMAIKWIF